MPLRDVCIRERQIPGGLEQDRKVYDGKMGFGVSQGEEPNFYPLSDYRGQWHIRAEPGPGRR